MRTSNRQWILRKRPVGEIKPGDLELIEQPLPAGDTAGYTRLHDSPLPIPIVVDGSCHTLPDTAATADIPHGPNIKWTTAGAIRRAGTTSHATRGPARTARRG